MRGDTSQQVQPLKIARLLWISTACVSMCGLVAEMLYHAGARSKIHRALIPFFSLSEEGNLPTWFSAGLLLSASLLLFAIARVPRDDHTSNAQWKGLAVIFLYLSLDESAQLHEQLGGLFKAGGVLYFDWIIPASAALLVFLAFYVPFLLRLRSRYRWGFVLAGAIYVGGALLMEMPLGVWAEVHGNDNPTYALLDWFEETLEMVGASLFLIFLYQYWLEALGNVREREKVAA